MLERRRWKLFSIQSGHTNVLMFLYKLLRINDMQGFSDIFQKEFESKHSCLSRLECIPGSKYLIKRRGCKFFLYVVKSDEAHVSSADTERGCKRVKTF